MDNSDKIKNNPEQLAAVTIVRDYLARMAEIRGTGGATKETSYYSALENLLNHFGKSLKPQVICNGQLRNEGAGNPDFGLYTRSQIQGGEPRKGQVPERGVVEVKPLGDNTWQTAKSEQATKYLQKYRLVLVTNYREFRLIGYDTNNKAAELERFTLASDEAAFWALAKNPLAAARAQSLHFEEFLKRVMMTAAPLVRGEDVAWFLASYARDALKTIQGKESANLAPLKTAVEDALGIHFEGDDGEHFFKSTLVQTLFYGMFSAWVVHAHNSTGKFDWKAAAYTLTVPMVKVLFEEIAKPTRLQALALIPLLERTAQALNRVDQAAFFKSFDSGEAVQHFYEPFLQAYDPELRKSMGVWYTPKEIVQYMVERVDHALRKELGRKNGLADKDVYVLDPCCGTGTYLVAVLRKIEDTLRQQGEDALLADDIKQAARERVFGFELMSAPYVVAHWQVGNYLSQIGAPFDAKKGERAAVFLTNSLTGWEPPKGAKANLPLFPELQQERDAAEHVKRDVPILVVIGNPPYNAFAGTSPDEESGLVEPYKAGLNKTWGIKKFNLDELYVRFMRLAQRRITEGTKQGVVCYISSFSYVADPSFVVMRKLLLNDFDRIWVDSLNGDSRETGKKTPAGEPDPSVFSTPFNPAGIKLGTSIGLFVRKLNHQPASSVLYRDFWGRTKRQDLVETLSVENLDSSYLPATPAIDNRFAFRPRAVSQTYSNWVKIIELADAPPTPGLQEMRFGALQSLDRAALEQGMASYLDPGVTWEEVSANHWGPVRDAGRFDAKDARESILKKEQFNAANIRRYSLYPFDNRWAYWTSVRPLWNEPRPALVDHAFTGNQFFVTRMAAERPTEGMPAVVTPFLPDYHLLRPNIVAIPFFLEHHGGGGLFGAERKANLSAAARLYLKSIGFDKADNDEVAPLLWWHSLAISYSSHFLSEHRDGILSDWLRIPLPKDRDRLERSASLGRRITELLNTDAPVNGVTEGKIDARLAPLAVLSAEGGKSLGVQDLVVSAGWGYRTKTGIMPGSGRTKMKDDYSEAEAQALGDGAILVLGKPIDVALNDVASWKSVPENVWEFRIGGYQVVKKWLSYREESVLGRALSKEEAREVTGMVRRLATLLLANKELNANYDDIGGNAYTPDAAKKQP